MKPELFDDAIGEFSASTIDLGAIVARQERKRAVRRASVVLLAAVTTLAFSVVAGLSLQTRPEPGRSPVAAGSMSSPPAVAEGPEAKAARVQAAWLRATAKVLPNATWRAGHDGSLEEPSRGDYYDQIGGPTPPPMFTRTNDVSGSRLDPAQWPTSDRLYHTFGIVKVGANEGRITVRTKWRASPDHRANSTCSTGPDGVMTCGDDFYCIDQAVCERSTGPHGEAIFTARETQQFKEYKLPYKSLWVWVRSADGTRTVEMTIENRAGGDHGPGPATTELALTEEQMLRILLEPGLMI